MTRPDGIVVAIDGPAASGKSSTAKAVATELGYRHLDSGAFYRAITLAALDREIPPERWPHLTREQLDSLQVRSAPGPAGFALSIAGVDASRRIRSHEVNSYVSIMAAIPAVRDWLLDCLRDTGREGGLVADGRDIGTVVFPDAELKVFLVCEPAERARRRLLEQGNANPSSEEIRNETARLIARDHRDASRETAPLRQADDAVLLDTTSLAFSDQVAAITRLAQARIGA